MPNFLRSLLFRSEIQNKTQTKKNSLTSGNPYALSWLLRFTTRGKPKRMGLEKLKAMTPLKTFTAAKSNYEVPQVTEPH